MSVSDLLKSFSRVTRERNRRRRPAGQVAMLTEQFETRTLLSNVTILGSALPTSPTEGSTGGGAVGNKLPLTNLPLLNSRPGAPVSVILKVDGYTDNDPGWIAFRNRGTGPIVTPAFDLDGDALTFNAEELRQIEEIWYRVAEDFYPFNINVTTIAPTTLNDFEHVMVVIGGSNDWAPAAGGWGVVNGFSGGGANTNYVFSGLFFNPHQISSAASHESGHTFGLIHQSLYDANGVKTDEYNPGDASSAPLMGVGYGTIRDTWWNGTSSASATAIQDDMAQLTRTANQTVQYRVDDYGNTIATAFRVPSTGPRLSVNGVLERNDDVDMFRFETDTGTVSFSAQGLDLNTIYPGRNLTQGTNLDLVIELLDESGNSLAISNPANLLSASLSASVAAGNYYLRVSSTGVYGAVGQYSVTADVIPLPTIPVMVGPTGEINQLNPLFEWTTGSNADHYELQVDNLTTKVTGYYTRDVDGTSHIAERQFVEGNYQARVRVVALNGSTSAWSNYANFTISIAAPAVPQITRPSGDITDSFPTFVWTGDAVTANYSLWVDDITNPDAPVRVIFRTAYADTTYEHFAPLKDGIYRAWVRAFNAVGEFSAWSTPVTFTIDAPVPAVPRITGPVATSTNETPRITWTAVDGAARYDLWVNNLTTGAAQYLRDKNISYKTPYFDTPALPQGSYEVWVRAANGNNELSKWSNSYIFTVDVQRPGVPSMIGPVGDVVDQTITTANPTFMWTAAVRAVKYDLWVNNVTTRQTQIIRQQNITDLSYVALNNLPQGDYRAWVRGINSADEVGEWSTVFIFNIDEPTPSVPTIVEPKPNPAGSVENPNPTFVWTSQFDAPFYEFRLDDTTANQTNVISVSNITTKMYTIPNDKRLAEHIYLAYVRGVNNAGEMSDWSPAFRVRIDVPNPTTPTILAPKLTSNDTTPTFEWKLDNGSFRYEILVRDLERNETIVLQVRSYRINQTDPTNKFAYYTLPDSQAFKTGTYRFWIRAFNAIGTASSWSAAQTFVISASLDVKDLKLVEPARLQSAEQFYSDATFYADEEAESQNVMESDVADVNPDAMQLASVVAAEDVDAMSVVMIERLMESLADPASMTSAMLSSVTFMDETSQPRADKTTTAAASILAMGMIPMRRRRREE